MQRDIELRDIQINNLKNSCVKNEQDVDRLLGDMNKQEENMNNCISKLKKTEFENTRLINDNVKLLNDNEKLRQKLLNITFMKSLDNDYENESQSQR